MTETTSGVWMSLQMGIGSIKLIDCPHNVCFCFSLACSCSKILLVLSSWIIIFLVIVMRNIANYVWSEFLWRQKLFLYFSHDLSSILIQLTKTTVQALFLTYSESLLFNFYFSLLSFCLNLYYLHIGGCQWNFYETSWRSSFLCWSLSDQINLLKVRLNLMLNLSLSSSISFFFLSN